MRSNEVLNLRAQTKIRGQPRHHAEVRAPPARRISRKGLLGIFKGTAERDRLNRRHTITHHEGLLHIPEIADRLIEFIRLRQRSGIQSNVAEAYAAHAINGLRITEI